SVVCVSIAVLGTVTSLLVRRIPPSNPQLQIEFASFTVPHDMRHLLRSDWQLLMALAVSSVFWMLAGMIPSAVNILGKDDLGLNDDTTSILTGIIGVGIATGSALGGLLSRGRINFGLIRV